MASKKRIGTELLALGFAAAITALFADHADHSNTKDSHILSQAQARAESAPYLEGPVQDVRLHRAAERWAVTDGDTTAFLDARTGELREVSFGPPR